MLPKQKALSLFFIIFLILTGLFAGLFINEYGKNQRLRESFENLNMITISSQFKFRIYYCNESTLFYGSIEEESITVNIKLKDMVLLGENVRQSINPIPYCQTDQIDEITIQIKDECNKAISLRAGRNASDLELIQTFLDFVGNIPNARDEDTKDINDYWNYPLETLFDGQGDCEDHAILFSTMCKAIGIEVLLIVGNVSDDETEKNGHMLSAVYLDSDNIYLSNDKYEYKGKEYYFCETTSPHSSIGENPWEYYIWLNEWKIY